MCPQKDVVASCSPWEEPDPSEQKFWEAGPMCSATPELLKHARRTLNGMYSVLRIMVSLEPKVYN